MSQPPSQLRRRNLWTRADWPSVRRGLAGHAKAWARRILVGELLLFLVPLALCAAVTLGGRSLVPFDALVVDPLFRDSLERHGITTPQNGLVSDLVFQNLVWKQYAVESLRHNAVPLWNPQLAGGMPFLAAAQHSMLYPTFLLHLLLGAERAFGWSALLHLWLAGLAMYALGRALGWRRSTATIIGLAWSTSSLVVANGVFPMIQAGMAWTPLLLAVIEWLAQQAGRPGASHWLPRGRTATLVILLGLSWAMIGLAGHAEALAHAALLALAYGLFRILLVTRHAHRQAGLRLAVWLSLGALAGTLVAGVQLIPFLEFARTNWRSGAASYDTVVGYAFGWRQLLTFLVPDAYGNPAHHAVWDIVSGQLRKLPRDAMWGVDWGAKNYVEAACYLGILTFGLAVGGLLAGRRKPFVWFLAGFGLWCLSLVFGLPTYRLLFRWLPGADQLHTPFRWIFPFALTVVLLAGTGLEAASRDPWVARRLAALGALMTALGAMLLTVLAFAVGRPRVWVDWTETVLGRLPGAREAALAHFATLEAFASYQYWNFTHLAVFLSLSGVALVLLHRSLGRPERQRAAARLMLFVTAIDLLLVSYRFQPAAPAELAQVRPAAVAWLQDACRVKWGRVAGYGSAKVLWPNTAMRFGVPDVRAYDSIIPRWTVDSLETVMPLRPPAGMLTYNRIGNLPDVDALAHPLIAALGVRYIVTTETLAESWLKLVYQDSSARVYENLRALPRAWLVNQVEVHTDAGSLHGRLATFDPSQVALLEEAPKKVVWRELEPGRQVFRPSITVRSDTETPNGFEVEVYGATPGAMLVLSEAWFPGWRAWVTTVGTKGPVEVEVPVYRADGMLRAVPVPQGLSTVRLAYSPLSVKVGLYSTFLGLTLLFLTMAYALWVRFVSADDGDPVRRVAVNSLGPMAAALLTKVVDFAFAMLMLRILGPDNAGKYYTAIVVIGFAEIFTNFGLNLLTARDVARQPDRGALYLTNTSLLRLVLWCLAMPLLAGYVAVRQLTGSPMATDTLWAIGLLALALIPGNLNAALTSLFQARERMVLPAGVSIVSTLAKVTLGAWVLLIGYGFVGLAAVAILVNWITFSILGVLAIRAGITASRTVSVVAMGAMTTAALPLMLNHLLQTVFFKIDVLLLDQIKGSTVVGWYSAAYKWVDATLIIPAYFTMALFPLLSRRALADPAGLRRAYDAGLRLLIAIALLVALVTTVLAEELVLVLAGRQYLPHGAIALQIMIWFLPLSFANGLTQYVLIAVDRQRWITWSFALAASFNVVANLILIPRFSYSGAAVVTILSELVLLVPFRWRLRDLGHAPLLALLWRPALATSVAAVLLAVLSLLSVPAVATAALGAAAYGAALYACGGVTRDELATAARVFLPRRQAGREPLSTAAET